MCGRYASSRGAHDLASWFHTEEPPEDQALPPTWNVAPTDPVHAVLQRDGARKQPYYLTTRDGSPLAMAGLYEVWAPSDGERLWTCTVLTTDAPDELGHIHDRTPLLVPPADWNRWLDPDLDDPGQDLLVPGTPGVLDAWPVSAAVGNVRNDGAELVAPERPEPTTLF